MTESIADIRRRLQSAQKGHARGAPAYSVYINRRIGRQCAAVAYRLGLSPNQVTAISAAHTFVGIALLTLLPVAWYTGVIVALLLALGYAWDSADGQVARLGGGGTIAGEWLDHFIDAIKIATLHLAVAVALFRHTDVAPEVLLIPLGFSVVATVTFFGMLLNDLLKGARGHGSTHARGGGTLLRSLILVPTDFGLVCWVFVLWGWTSGFLVAYAGLALAALLFLALAAVKWFREMSALEDARA